MYPKTEQAPTPLDRTCSPNNGGREVTATKHFVITGTANENRVEFTEANPSKAPAKQQVRCAPRTSVGNLTKEASLQCHQRWLHGKATCVSLFIQHAGGNGFTLACHLVSLLKLSYSSLRLRKASLWLQRKRRSQTLLQWLCHKVRVSNNSEAPKFLAHANPWKGLERW